jgi:hypothetical protein
MIAALLITLGWALLAASQPRSLKRVAPRTRLSPAAQWALRFGGGALQLAALALLLRDEGAGFGALLWGCLWSTGAFVVAFALTALARRAPV